MKVMDSFIGDILTKGVSRLNHQHEPTVGDDITVQSVVLWITSKLKMSQPRDPLQQETARFFLGSRKLHPPLLVCSFAHYEAPARKHICKTSIFGGFQLFSKWHEILPKRPKLVDHVEVRIFPYRFPPKESSQLTVPMEVKPG